MILIVDRCLDLIALFNFSDHVGALIGVQSNLLPILSFDEIVSIINTEQFPLDCLLTACLGTFLVHLPLPIVIGLKIILLRIGY